MPSPNLYRLVALETNFHSPIRFALYSTLWLFRIVIE